MFRKLGITILGVVENMGIHICTHCGHSESIFGSEGGGKLAAQFEVPLLGKLPLDKRICAEADVGKPTLVSDPEGEISALYREIAHRVTTQLSLQPRDYSLGVRTVLTE